MTNAGIINRPKENIASSPSNSQSPRFSDLSTRFITRSFIPLNLSRERQPEGKRNEDNTFRTTKPPDPRGPGLGGFVSRVRLVGACRKQLPVSQSAHVA